MSTLKALLSVISKPAVLRTLLSFHSKGYLKTIGWFNAFEKKQAIDQDGNPIPWVTYSFIDFIKDRIHSNHRIFEYGSGNSTKFYAQHSKSVTSVEHDQEWYERVKLTNPSNAEIIFSELHKDGAYSQMAKNAGAKYHIIIVDGRDRVNCCKYSIDALEEDGVVVLDDSERPFYNSARIFLTGQGFKEIKFSGISPGLFYEKATSVFYKADNCLGI